jgi:hypothetical protein
MNHPKRHQNSSNDNNCHRITNTKLSSQTDCGGHGGWSQQLHVIVVVVVVVVVLPIVMVQTLQT